jgi:hypothetical protein
LFFRKPRKALRSQHRKELLNLLQICLAKLSLPEKFKGEEKADKENLKCVIQQRGANGSVK